MIGGKHWWRTLKAVGVIDDMHIPIIRAEQAQLIITIERDTIQY